VTEGESAPLPRAPLSGVYPYLDEHRDVRLLVTLVAPVGDVAAAWSGPARELVRLRVVPLGPETRTVDLANDPPIDFSAR
jgi:hypothetical protein